MNKQSTCVTVTKLPHHKRIGVSHRCDSVHVYLSAERAPERSLDHTWPQGGHLRRQNIDCNSRIIHK